MRIPLYLLLIVILLTATSSFAQQEVFKVSKLISKEYPDDIRKINLAGEKASISIEGWNNRYTEIRIRLVSRNEDKKRAEADLRYIIAETVRKNDTLIIRNYFEGKGDLISSNLSVEYTLKVPPGLEIQVMDLYGAINLKNLNNPLKADISFGTLEVESVSGTLTATSRYSKVNGNNITGKIILKVEKTDVFLVSAEAPVTIDSRYGEINLDLSSNKFPVTVNGQRSKLIIAIPEADFNYQLKTLYSEIEIPGLPVIKDDRYEKKTGDKNGTLCITTTYCPITIKKKK